ncbi:MAG: type IV pilus twitching motility protein PilT [Candidatus Sumerlaeota bacterium]
MNLPALLDGMKKVNATDLHLRVNTPPTFRVNSRLRPIDHPALSKEDIEQTIQEMMPDYVKDYYEKVGVADFAYSQASAGRFRFAAYRQSGSLSVAIRRISLECPLLQDLNLPDPVYRLTKEHRGLVLVTGVTGSGKSTTLAGLLQEINKTRRSHIVTLEDPIEYVFEQEKSLINQIEIGRDTSTFHDAMKHVVRLDPDIVMVGEMRSRDTIAAALEAADTGHLVFSTLHTSDAKQTVNRILHFFPKEDEDLILEQLSLNLRSIISQRLLRRADKDGLIPTIELLFNTPIVSKLIREGRIDDMQQTLKNRDEGMQTFDASLVDLVKAEKITMETALEYCADEAGLRRMVRGESSAGDSAGLIGSSF